MSLDLLSISTSWTVPAGFAVFVSAGFVEINPEKCILLAETVNEMNDLDKSTIENEIRNLESENSDSVNNKLYVARKKIEALESTFYKN